MMLKIKLANNVTSHVGNAMARHIKIAKMIAPKVILSMKETMDAIKLAQMIKQQCLMTNM